MTIRINHLSEVRVTNPYTLEFSIFTVVPGDVITLADNVDVFVKPFLDEKIQDEEKSE